MATNSGTNGLDQIGQAIKKHRTDILLTVAAIATAESKWKAIGAAIKDFAVWKMVGPLAIILGSLKGIEGVTRAILRDTGSLRAVLERMSQMQGLERQFKTLLGSINAARQRVAELVQFTNKQKLFDLSTSGTAARELEILTKGAFAGGRALDVVGDAAAGTSNSIESVAGRVGEFHRVLQEGEPIRATAGELARMGVISEQAANHLVTMQESGAGVTDIFTELLGQLGKHKGAMDQWTKTVDGVTASYEQAHKALAKKFGEPFKEAEMARMKDTTAVLNALQKPVADLAQWLAKLASPIENISVRIGAWLDRLGVLHPVLSVTAAGIKVLASGLVVLGTAWGIRAIGSFIASVIQVAATGDKASKAIAGLRASAAAANSAVTNLRAGNAALAVQQTAAAGSALKEAAALGIAATAARGFGLALRAAMSATIVGALIALLGYGVEKLWNWITSTQKAAEAQRELALANSESLSSLQKQIREIGNLDDAQRALISTTEALTDAQRKLNQLRREGAPGNVIAEQEGFVSKLRQQASGLSTGMKRGVFGNSTDMDAELRAQAARALRLHDLARDNAIERATGSDRIRLMEEKRQRLAADAATGRGTAMERRMIDEAMKKLVPGAGAAGFREALERRAASPIIREERAIQDLRGRQRGGENHAAEIQQRERALVIMRERLEVNQQANEEGAMQLAEQIRTERKMQDLRYEDVNVERQIARLRDRGFDREEKAAEARLDALRGQQQVMRTFDDEQGEEDVQGRIDAAERELRLMRQRAQLQREMDASHLRVLEIETNAANAAVQNQFEDADRLQKEAIAKRDDLEKRRSFEEKMDSGAYSEESARIAVEEEQAQREREREARRIEFRTKAARDIEMGSLAASGNAEDADKFIRMQNEDALREKIREGLAAGLSSNEATSLAVPQILNQIAQSRGPVVASGIQRIGGGGGSFGGDIQKEQRDLLRDAVNYLEKISGNSESTDRSPNTGETYTGD